ncbi:M42 glutamyl aminopeptidase family protein [Listeria grandensis FSL F6-0971]|uniref:M42 glutamyl aminopeptidase family protein n=1 Tax=Listeria grandensis FSL F6-0971 TaxID=1265819 RepID=W7BTL9_9LIST|nr:M20/M25/M40 family metallo-hydrolase [Listeria grandensis]EUJ23683.1 M42 glutamyl aminopeptidase family protein [Listeria grandensis FSL F6-0971]
MVNKSRLVDTFIELVKIDSETKHEGKFQKYLKERFQSLGLEVIEDDTMAETGFGANNLLCRLPGNVNADAIFFSCHMDTVTPGLGIKPEIREDIIYSDGTTILAADDKAGIAIMLETVALIQENNTPHGTLEFVLSVGEESGLIGIKAFDMRTLKASHGFVLDTGGPVGSITVGSPTHAGLEIQIDGTAAHAGIEPEKGISALEIAAKAISQMKLGRVDFETTANIGIIEGGTATNIVMEHVRMVAEVRSINSESCEAQIQHMKDLFEKTTAEMGGAITIKVDRKYSGFDFNADNTVVKIATEAMAKLGMTANHEVSGGGSDANIFNEQGKETTNLSIGYEKIHTVHEYIPIRELEKATALAYEIVKQVVTK